MNSSTRTLIVEITSMPDVRHRLDDAIQVLRDYAPIIGDPDLLDFAGTVGRRG